MDIWHVYFLGAAFGFGLQAVRYARKYAIEREDHRDYRLKMFHLENLSMNEENWCSTWRRRCCDERGRAIRYQRQIMAAVDREWEQWRERDLLRKNMEWALDQLKGEHSEAYATILRGTLEQKERADKAEAEIEAMKATAGDLDASYRNELEHLRAHNKSLEATNRQLRNGHGSQQ